ncbi:MAG: protein kinase, partial [Archangium sp.]|nr:protein kinase [Archangium sp.]
SDVYQLAAVLHACASGAPFSRDTSQRAPLKPVARHLAAVLDQALSDDPSARPARASVLAEALVRANAGLAPNRTRASRVVARAPDTSKLKVAGDTLGSYRLERVLGEGAMGHVFLATHVTLGRKVAIKVLRPELSGTPELIQRFFQEARSVNQINHEHIVEIFDFVEEPGTSTVYCVMEALDGASLSVLLERDPLPLARATDIVRQLCEALSAAHAVGVVHRDVKPDNIFVTQRSGRDYVKVLDFGVAKLTSQTQPKVLETEDGAIFGTPTYMSPEQAEGRVVDHRSDIWAVGVLLYEVLAGVVPFQGQSFAGLAAKIIGQPPPPLPTQTAGGEPLTPALRALVLWCLKKEPSQRPQSMDAVAAALAEMTVQAVGTPTTVTPPPGAPAAVEPRARSPWPLVAAAVGLGVLGTVAALRFMPAPSAPVVVAAPIPSLPVIAEIDAGPPEEDAGTSASFDAGAAEIAPSPAPIPVAEARPKKALTAGDITAVVSRAQGQLRKCFERHRADLPGGEGKVTITLSIDPSGAVTAASTHAPGLKSGALSDCIVGHARKLRFPRHLGGVVTVNVPFAYRVE